MKTLFTSYLSYNYISNKFTDVCIGFVSGSFLSVDILLSITLLSLKCCFMR